MGRASVSLVRAKLTTMVAHDDSNEEAPTVDSYMPIYESLSELGRARGTGEIRFDRAIANDQVHFMFVFGLARHVMCLAEPAVKLLSEGKSLEALPLVRVCYETALTAQWAARRRASVHAMLNEYDRNQRAVQKDLERAVSKVLREGAESFMDLEDELAPTGAEDAARSFERMCDELLPSGSDKYVHYRLLSRMVHPGPLLVDQYIFRPDASSGAYPSLRDLPKQPRPGAFLAIVCASLLWALSAVDYLELKHPNDRALHDLAETIGVASSFRLTPDAQRVDFEASRAIRRSKWKGRRRRPE